MHNAPPPLNALRAFEAAARHLSLTQAALELNVTPGALSHQIRGLEDHLGLKLFDRGVRSIALTAAGKALQPGLQTGFLHIRDALASLKRLGDARVLVVSAPPGFTSKWLAPRLYRFSIAWPDIDVRVSSSINNANFIVDGVDAAVRNLAVDAAHDQALEVEKLIDQSLVPVRSRAFVEKHGPFATPDRLKRVPLIHDDSLSSRARMPTWADWFAAAGVRDAASVAAFASTAPITRSTRRSKAPACCSLSTRSPTTICAPGASSCPSTSPCPRAAATLSCAPRRGATPPMSRPSAPGSGKRRRRSTGASCRRTEPFAARGGIVRDAVNF